MTVPEQSGATALIALDWGTTSARAYRIGRDGTVLGEHVAPLGVSQVQEHRFAPALNSLLGDWNEIAVPRLACGMIGSRQGWVEAPYVSCPAGLVALATNLATVEEAGLAIVPGVRTRDQAGVPDVMRGEETQLLGAVDAELNAALAVLPGTHSKWAHVARGCILDFTTFMTGEVYSVMLAHSILGRLAAPHAIALESTGEVTEIAAAAARSEGFHRGVTRGLANGALLHDLFGARTLALTGELPASQVTDWLSGLLIGREIAQARAWAAARGLAHQSVHVFGTPLLTARYAEALRIAEIRIASAPADAAARGLWRIASAARLVKV